MTLKKRNSDKTIPIWAVYAKEINPPSHGATPLSWLLLTTLPITNFDEAVEKLKWYAVRWKIEVYHKIIKSGCRIEDRQLGSRKALEACLAVDMIVAWRVFFLTIYPRLYPDAPCTDTFTTEEWQALYSIKNQTYTLPSKPSSIRSMIRMVASLGGFLCRKMFVMPRFQLFESLYVMYSTKAFREAIWSKLSRR